MKSSGVAMMNKVIELIRNAETVAVLGHESEDGDSVGSCYAMKAALVSMGKKADCWFSDEIAPYIAFVGRDYTVFDGTDVPEYDLCLCIDCGDIKRIGKRAAIFDKAAHTACIDHHETNGGFTDADYIEPYAAAAAEILYKLFMKMNIVMTPEIARNLYIGISTDTGSFKYSNVSPETMEIAAQLLRYNINHAETARLLYDTVSPEVMRFNGYVMSNIESFCGGKICIFCADGTLLKRFGVSERDIGDIVNIPRMCRGCEIAVSVRETPEKIKVSLRSNGDISAAEIAAQFGGGGHARAAGFSQTNKTVAEVKEKIIEACEVALNG